MYKEVCISKVTPLGIGGVYDLSVEGCHQYVGNGLLNHNSAEPNLQQIPKTSVDPNIKKQLIARPGQLYLVMDFSQCIDGESYIFCDTGIKKLKDINPNKDRIYLTDPREPYGAQYKVIEGVTYKGNAKCIKIVTNTGRELILTPDHRVKTLSGYTPAGNLQPGDTLFIERVKADPQLDFMGSLEIDPLEAYIAGLFYGDGFYPKEKSGNRKESHKTIAFSTGLDRDELKSLLDKYFSTSFRTLTNKPHHAIYGCSDRVPEFYQKYPKADSHNMVIPVQILEANRESKMYFLAGQIDSDGHIGNGSIVYASACKEYVRQLQLLFQSVGYSGIIRVSHPKLNGKTYTSYHLRIPSIEAIKEFRNYLQLERKRKDCDKCLQSKKEASPSNRVSHCPTSRIPSEVYWDLPYTREFYKTRKNSRRKGRLIRSTLGSYLEGLSSLDSRWLDVYGYNYESVDHLEEAGYHDVYDLSVQDIHEFNPNGIRVHNCELRIMAHLSKDDTYLKAFKENKDPHLAIAAQKYGVPYEEAEKIYEDENHPDYKLWKTRRKQAKQIAFGLIYGIQSKLLSVKLSDPKAGLIVTPEEAQQMMDDYFKEHPRIKKFMASQEKLLYKQGYIKSLFGNKRRLPGIYSENNADVAYAVRLSLNFPCQSAASHMTLFGAVLNYWDMKRGYFPPMDEICTVHDAVYYNTDPKYINVYTIWKLWDTFRNPKTKQYFNFQIDDVDMSMEFEIGRTMGEELPFIPGYDYNKMLQPDFSVEAYMEEYHKHKGLLIKEFPERFPELFEQGKEWRKLK